ncbi:PAS domain-containing protein [Piscinibacter sp.]|uniref:PAS domain-containing protein n=1 Tax=Piscinibacter sp. TaxID=1903157 RepID=UPI001B762DC6|nr:PAS domain-containing protein [Piscinibacter sp.]MBK7533346.1 PAS domain-containing protein [Piscinibacter sp.]MBP6541405.1 PAS domain-containing protein [Piscinibacter sp.]
MQAPVAGLEAELDAARLRLHHDATPSSAAAAALAGLVLAMLLRPAVPADVLVGWLCALAAALLLRLLVRRAHGLAGDAVPASTWMFRYRAGFLIHGLVWLMLGLVAAEHLDTSQAGLVMIVFAAMCGGALVTAAFDPWAGALFALPSLAPVVLRLLAVGGQQVQGTAAAIAIFMVVMLIVVGRQKRTVFDMVRAQLAERTRASDAEQARRELADQTELQQQLLRTTSQGYWFIDTEGRTTDLNAAMCALLGHPREAVIGRAALDFFDGEGRAVLERELERRRSGAAGAYEIDIVRPDGSRAHCLNNATPLFGSDGRRVGSVGLWTDITAQKLAEQWLRTHEWLVNAVTDPVSVIGGDRAYLMVNDAWCKATGLAREAVIGRPVSQVLGPGRFNPEHARALDECFATRIEQRVLSRVHMQGRGERLLESIYYPHLDVASGVNCVGALSRDITAEERAMQLLQASEAEQRALLEAFPGFIAAVDREHRYTYVNSRLAAAFGRPAQDIVGRHAHEVLDAPTYAAIAAEIERARLGETVRSERTYPAAADRPQIDLEVSHVAGPLAADGNQRFYAFGVDITSRNQALAALTAARDEAERANRTKSQFLAQMSHELRTPMNAIVGFGQLLENDPQQPLAAHQRRYVQEVLRAASHLLGLMNELLDLGRIEAGHLTVDVLSVPLAGLADECLALVRPLALPRRVMLHPAAVGDLAVAADPTRLRQVLLNLLGNAVKYNRVGGEVRLVARREGAEVQLSVHDTGPGIAARDLGRLFQPFERIGAEHSGIEGAGIGLALSQRLVHAMGGRIGVNSEPGRGSMFWVALPVAELPLPGAVPAAVLPPLDGVARSSVLYIEDNPVNVALMEAMLARLPGVALRCAPLPLDGLRMAAESPPALILLDIQMPGMDGFEVLARLRSRRATAHIPVVAVSANALPGDVEAAMKAGFSAYLTKPLGLDELLLTVQRMLRESAARG